MKFEKLVLKMRQNKRDHRIQDIILISEKIGIQYSNNGGSHYTFKHCLGTLCIPKSLDIHPSYITNFLRLVDKVIENAAKPADQN